MRRIFYFLIFLILIINSSCSFLASSSKGYDNAVNQINAVTIGDIDKAISYFDITLSDTAQANPLKRNLPDFQKIIVENFGTEFELSFSSSDKKFSFSTADDSELVIEPLKLKIQIKNDTHFGIIEATINEENDKILYIKLLDYKERVPSSYLLLYLAGLIALCVVIANFTAIYRINKSELGKKWLLILGVLFLNIPTITLTALGHLKLDLSFQMLLGVAASATGIEETFISFGIPIGAIIAFVKLKRHKLKKEVDDVSTL